MRVMLGGCTRSSAASSPTVRSPWRYSAAEHRHLASRLSSLSGVPLAAQPAAQPHHGDAELDGEPGVGAGDLLDGGHVVSITHYPC